MKFIKIGNKKIHKNSNPFIIAEAGINHNGELKKALQMISIAKDAGVDAIKFQTYKTEQIITDNSLSYSYLSQGKKITESQFELFKRCELSYDDFKIIKKKCVDKKIIFMSTPSNYSDVNLLKKLKISVIKIGSDDFTNIPLIKNVIKTKLPLIISCGMTNLDEIKMTLESISTFKKNYPTILMLTTSEYPTTAENVNLSKFITLTNHFPDLILGYSDHTQNNIASSMAVAFGAKVFEKHFTISRKLPGPDHWFSLDSNDLKNWVDSIRISHKSLGNYSLKPTKMEVKMKQLSRKSLVAIKDINKNDLFDNSNVGIKRPGNGLEPINFLKIYGKKSKRKILKDTKIKKTDF
tara:strand:- start:34072 stop:35124 length:1053 start_codon:yes stop_codon:yes gene_type:complete